jgi:prepilin-type N-terminal cleavage/methylation domain-containing protein
MENQRNELRISAAMSQGMFTLIELMVVVGIISILASFLFSSLTRARETAMQVHCCNNLKQLSSASILYRNDHKKFPFAEKYYMDDFSKIYPYLRNLKVFVCTGNPQSVGNVPNEAAPEWRDGLSLLARRWIRGDRREKSLHQLWRGLQCVWQNRPLSNSPGSWHQG